MDNFIDKNKGLQEEKSQAFNYTILFAFSSDEI